MEVPFEPMLLKRVSQPFADPGWLYQVKWDGVRNLALVEGGTVRHWSRRRRDRTELYPELAGLGALFHGKRTVLDGEIIVLRDGKPSFSGALERDLGGRPDSRKVRAYPAVFMIFDLLEFRGKPLYRRPLEERLELLEQSVVDAPFWQVVTSFPGTGGPDLFNAVGSQGMEGVVAKRLGSHYVPGTRTGNWVKIKHRREILAVVVGYTHGAGQAGALLLGAYRGDRLVYVGRAGSGLKTATMAAIKQQLSPAPCPFAQVPSLQERFSGPAALVVWVEPRLTVQVSFQEWTDQGRLRDPVVVGVSAKPPEAAQV